MKTIENDFFSNSARRKNTAVNILKRKASTYQKKSADLEKRIPRYSEKDIVWISETEQGIIKKVTGIWNEKTRSVQTKYHVLVFNGRKKKIHILSEKQVSKTPEYFEKKA